MKAKILISGIIAAAMLPLPLAAEQKEVAKLPLVHPHIGDSLSAGRVKVKLFSKRQRYGGDAETRDMDIVSPKSVNVHPSGKKFYVNSLEGASTVVYSLPDLRKLAVIPHKFTAADAALWAPESGLFKFRHYSKDLNTFTGKPVESEFSHGGRYLWVPYYRRSYDINAQDPSAVAIIDTRTDKIVRIMEAGVLPKMIALSPDGRTMAVTHWGDNTVGLIDVASDNPADWKYTSLIAVGRQLFHNFSLTTSVDRDSNTGEALRGTVFTPDGRYLLVGCMSGGGIAVIDVAARKYLGKITGMMGNLRHLVIAADMLYLSINASGYVQRILVAEIMKAIARLDGSGNTSLSGWQSCKVASGARTLEVSPDGAYIFVACNSGSRLCVVDSTMKLVGEMSADSFPVGLDLSPDGKWLITTSQGRKGSGGGNCVDIFTLSGLETDFVYRDPDSIAADTAAVSGEEAPKKAPAATSPAAGPWALSALIVAIAGVAAAFIFRRKNKHK